MPSAIVLDPALSAAIYSRRNADALVITAIRWYSYLLNCYFFE